MKGTVYYFTSGINKLTIVEILFNFVSWCVSVPQKYENKNWAYADIYIFFLIRPSNVSLKKIK